MDKGHHMATSVKEAPLDISKVRQELLNTVHAARQGGHLFLIYLLAMVLEELTNIERGRPTEL